MYGFVVFVYDVLFVGRLSMAILFFSCLLGLILISAVTYRFESSSLFLASIAILMGIASLLMQRENIGLESLLPLISVLVIMLGISYVLFFIGVKVSLKRKRVREERERQAREMRYELPQRDNTFVRARLGCISNDNVLEETKDVVGDINLRFIYAQGLLAKLRLKTLAATERLEMDELASIFAVYAQKEGYVGEDVRLINDAFSRVLKLAAKYAV